mgnify:CR=1 FL=1
MPFKIEKVVGAISKAMTSVNNGTTKDAKHIAKQVYKHLLERKKDIPNYVPNVEEIQDLVEQTLMKSEFLDVASGKEKSVELSPESNVGIEEGSALEDLLID